MTITEATPTTAAYDDPVRGSSAPEVFWTTANVGEAAPSVLTPLCWSLWGAGNESAVLRCWHRFGMLGPDQVRVDPDQSNCLTGVFFGRLAMNLDIIREWVDRLPGLTADEFEFGLAGAVHPQPRTFTPLTEAQQDLVAESVERIRDTHGPRLATMVADQEEWWTREVLARTEPGDPVARLVEAYDRFVWALGIHNETRLLAVASTSLIYRIAAAVEALPLVPAVTSAFGDVTELSMAADLWSLAQGTLEMDTFIERHGFHGSNEGNAAGRSWRESPELLRGVVDSLRSRGADEHPDRRAERAVARQRAALADLEAKLDDEQVAQVRAALQDIAMSVRETELGKAAFLRGIDGVRAAARDLGAQLVAEARLEVVDDIFMFTYDELRADRGTAVPSEELALRRARLEDYRAYTLPQTFRGMPEPIVKSAERAAVGDVITGVGASGQVHEGTVRIIRRTDDEDALEPGDVLVCEATDPSWTPLFLLADAVVIDIGSVGSHGAIVARELGLPAVLNTIDGSRRLRDGDRVRVDGAAGTVTVLELG